MATAHLTPEGPEFTVEYDMIDVTTSLPTPDKTWRYIDRHGHEHHWDHGYPTLRRVVDDVYWYEGDEIEESHLGCPLCGEVIKPGLKPPSAFREYVQGRARYYLADQEISAEQASEILNAKRPPHPEG